MPSHGTRSMRGKKKILAEVQALGLAAMLIALILFVWICLSPDSMLILN